MTPPNVQNAVDAAFAEEAARIVAHVVRVTGDWDLAEDCMQDAFIKALHTWTERGIPANPGGWLTTVAKNRAIDRVRSDAREQRALGRIAYDLTLDSETRQGSGDDRAIDDRLSLIFICCDTALSTDSCIALTLRTVAGLSLEATARAFLVSIPTMTKRLVRARAKIKDAGTGFRFPSPKQLIDRTDAILSVLYLLFNEGYTGTGRSSRIDRALEAEAIRLTRAFLEFLTEPEQLCEAQSLLALMLLHSSRDLARFTPQGEPTLLGEQDRTLWDREAIAEAVDLLNTVSMRLGHRQEPGGRYFLEASIAAHHALDTMNFPRIADLYGELAFVVRSPVIELNRAVAVAMADGPEVGLRLVEGIVAEGKLANYYLLPATRGDLLRRLGRRAEAASYYKEAVALAPSEAERSFLVSKLTQLSYSDPLAHAGPDSLTRHRRARRRRGV
ncbi:RNA polymerase sigma factor [Rathayibacter sp. KR2-224]|uniref:RNA polymerase sigma factor n=1 Tax=Rathayibacter sp. KR2-224 TaxID=3400913 RepID=UPI003BFD8BA4